jgi:hypothetical protein
MFLRERLLQLQGLPQKTTALLSLVMLFLGIASGAIAGSTKLKTHESAAAPDDPATVLRVKLLLEKDSPIMEIMSSRPLRPTITKIEDPPGLKIDLNNAQISIRHKQIAVQNPLIGAIQINQLALSPPVVRIVVDELKPLSYTWDAAGNRLTIRLHLESEAVKAKPPSVPTLTHGAEPVAVPVSTGRNAVFADRLASGSSFSAGFDTETLRLSRGGEVHVCPGTTVSIVHPQNGPDLMMAMGVGALETHYALENSADTIITPDFRILLRGPGEFHYAIRADSQGNTCVRALPGNTAPVVVYESIGDGQFEVVPSEKLVFHSGHLSSTDTAFHSEHLTQVETLVPDDCGCPAPIPVLRAELPETPVLAENNISSVSLAPQSGVEAELTQPVLRQDPSGGPETAPLPALGPHEKPVEFEARLEFSRKDAPPPKAVDLPLSSREVPFPDSDVAQPVLPQLTSKKAHKGVFKKVTGFLSRIFH